jgi:hypothetical protein
MRLAVAAVALGSVLGLGGASPVPLLQLSRDRLDMKDALAFAEFPLFSAGNRVDGLPLTAVLRREGPADFVTFVYGDCTAADDAGCTLPAEVQVWPACRRNLHLYESGWAGTPALEYATVRGVPAALLDDGLRLELQTSRSTVVVFGDSRARVRRVAAALRAVGKPTSAAPLPPPTPGAVEGTRSC